MQAHSTRRNSIYDAVLWWYSFTRLLVWKTIKEMWKIKLTFQYDMSKGSLQKNLQSHILHILMPCISDFLLYLHFIQCLLFCFHLIIMFLHAVTPWLDERLEQISHCCFSSVSVVWSQQNLPHSSGIDWCNFHASFFHVWTVSPLCRRSAH